MNTSIATSSIYTSSTGNLFSSSSGVQLQCLPTAAATTGVPPVPSFAGGQQYRTYYYSSLPVDSAPKCNGLQVPSPPFSSPLQQIRSRFFPAHTISQSDSKTSNPTAGESSYLANKVAATLLQLHEPVLYHHASNNSTSLKLVTTQTDPPSTQLATTGNEYESNTSSTSPPILCPPTTQFMLQAPYHHPSFPQTAPPCWQPGGWSYVPLPSSGAAAHQDYKSNSCHICGKTYARLSTLRSHVKSHSGEKPYQCSICQKSFTQAANLTAHLRTHSGEKPFKCPVCHRGFSQSSSVTTHMRTHSGDRPYKCNVCNKGFADSSTLTKHYRTHTGEKPYQCKICEARFSQSGNLNRHMRTHRHHFVGNLDAINGVMGPPPKVTR